jgi:hypothetical protein
LVRGSESSPQAQLKAQDIALVPKALLKDIELRVETNGKISRGPSIALVINTSERISLENVTSEGFGERPSVINDDEGIKRVYDQNYPGAGPIHRLGYQLVSGPRALDSLLGKLLGHGALAD